MTSTALRNRIAQRAGQSQDGTGRPQTDTGHEAEAPPGHEDPWEFLFDAVWPEPDLTDDAEFSPRRWLAEGRRGLHRYLCGLGLDDEFWGHLRAAERELLLAWRALIEARLRRLEKTADSDAPAPSRRQEIEVEFD